MSPTFGILGLLIFIAGGRSVDPLTDLPAGSGSYLFAWLTSFVIDMAVGFCNWHWEMEAQLLSQLAHVSAHKSADGWQFIRRSERERGHLSVIRVIYINAHYAQFFEYQIMAKL